MEVGEVRVAEDNDFEVLKIYLVPMLSDVLFDP
jgi:hypothetical protein